MNVATANDELFQSAAGMTGAVNYNDWTFSLFAPYVRGRILEVGCGVGTFTRMLAAAPGVTSILSIDVVEAAVTHCRAAVPDSRVDVRMADVRAVEGTFDLVLCMNVLEHIEDDGAALRHMIERLAPGATLFLLVPSHQWLYSSFDRESGHYRRYNKRRMQSLLASAAPGLPVRASHFYFNAVGAIGYGVVYRLLRKNPHADAGGEIGLFDRRIVPLQRRLEGRGLPFGLSLVSIITNTATS